jgi:hypothetical protein
MTSKDNSYHQILIIMKIEVLNTEYMPWIDYKMDS